MIAMCLRQMTISKRQNVRTTLSEAIQIQCLCSPRHGSFIDKWSDCRNQANAHSSFSASPSWTVAPPTSPSSRADVGRRCARSLPPLCCERKPPVKRKRRWLHLQAAGVSDYHIETETLQEKNECARISN